MEGNSIFDLNKDKKWGNGTGFIVSPNGYIVTNEHVAGSKGHKVIVTLEDGREFTGSTMWSNQNTDIAIIKINETGLNYLNLGDSSNVKIGQNIYAIGNPIGFEFQRTVTSRNN